MSEEFETYDNTRPQEPQNGQPAGNAYNMSQGYGYGYGNQNAGANTGAYSNGYNAGANGSHKAKNAPKIHSIIHNTP